MKFVRQVQVLAARLIDWKLDAWIAIEMFLWLFDEDAGCVVQIGQ